MSHPLRFLLLLPCTAAAVSAQQYTWAVHAGLPPQTGSADGAPSAARYNRPANLVADAAGNVFVSDTFNHTIRKLAPDGTATTLAGLAGNSGAVDATSAAARFFNPQGLALDSSGNLFVADSFNHVIRKITPAGVVSTVAGLARTFGSADGPPASARFNVPYGLAMSRDGSLYVTDRASHTVRRIAPYGTVTTVAGAAGTAGSADGPGLEARFFGPAGITADAAGNLYLADSSNFTIRKLGADGVVSTVAGSARLSGSTNGTGAAARFTFPLDVAVDDAGNLFVADTNNDVIRRITPAGAVTLIAGALDQRGSADGTGTVARFFAPAGVARGPNGSIFVADTSNHSIRRLSASADVSTFSGAGGNFGNADGFGTNARFNFPQGVGIDRQGDLFVTDTRNSRIRRVRIDGLVSTFARLPGTGYYGMAVDRTGNLVVTDVGADTIRIYSTDGPEPYLDVGTAGRSGRADGDYTQASFANPYGVALDPNLPLIYVADTSNHTIRRLTFTANTITVTTLAGSPGVSGSADGTGAEARFNFPRSVAVDRASNIYVADTNNGTIRKITPAGVVTTLAGSPGLGGTVDGTGAAARFTRPYALTVDATGTIFVTDSAAATVRRVTTAGSTSTIGGLANNNGHAEGTGTTARFYEPVGIAVDDEGAVYVVNAGNNVILKGVLDRPPEITAPPQSLPVLAGTGVTLSVGATGGGLRYQWRRDGTAIAGATAASHAIASAQPAAAGSYSVEVTNSAGTVISAPALISVVDTTNVGRIINLAIRSQAGTGADTLIVGLGIGGNNTRGSKPVLFRCAGPALGAFGVADVLADPKLEIYAGPTKISENDNWAGDAQVAAVGTQVGAFSLGAATSRDAALHLPAMAPGSYTVQMTGSGGSTGIVLAEIYDSTPADQYAAATPRLINVSARTRVGVGGDILIAGFVVGGATAKTVLIRAIGPTLGAFGVPGALDNPKLELFAGTKRINDNDNWGGATAIAAAARSVGAFPLVDATADAALLVTLAPGSYTAQVTGVSGTTGVALVEVYEVP